MELIEVVSERMKALLEAYDYSQYMLFLKSGVPRSTISMILNCRVTDVRLSTLYNFCRGFELPVRDFFDYGIFSTTSCLTFSSSPIMRADDGRTER